MDSNKKKKEENSKQSSSRGNSPNIEFNDFKFNKDNNNNNNNIFQQPSNTKDCVLLTQQFETNQRNIPKEIELISTNHSKLSINQPHSLSSTTSQLHSSSKIDRSGRSPLKRKHPLIKYRRSNRPPTLPNNIHSKHKSSSSSSNSSVSSTDTSEERKRHHKKLRKSYISSTKKKLLHYQEKVYNSLKERQELLDKHNSYERDIDEVDKRIDILTEELQTWKGNKNKSTDFKEEGENTRIENIKSRIKNNILEQIILRRKIQKKFDDTAIDLDINSDVIDSFREKIESYSDDYMELQASSKKPI